MHSLLKNQNAAQANILTKRHITLFVPAIATLVSVGMALVGIFLLSSWAEASPLHHGLQHVVIFLAGAGFGSSLIAGYNSRQGSNKQ